MIFRDSFMLLYYSVLRETVCQRCGINYKVNFIFSKAEKALSRPVTRIIPRTHSPPHVGSSISRPQEGKWWK